MQTTINCKGTLLNLKNPIVMGILNVTPDSFYDGGKFTKPQAAILYAKKMIKQGAKIIDIGAYSSRPGAKNISEKQELDRLLPIIEGVISTLPEIIISVDTFRAEVAKQAVLHGAAIINDISAGNDDPKMFETVAKLKTPYIMMHKKGLPATMQKNPQYNDLITEIIQFFAQKTEKAKLMGINDVIIDPGFGFGKTLEHNFELLNSLEKFKIFEIPIMVGVSRKSMIYNTLEVEPKDSLAGTIAINTVALLKGASILRVHDVKEAVDTIKITSKIAQHDKWDIIGQYF